jgi:hypothetical protein
MSSRQLRKSARRNGAKAAGTKSQEGIKKSSMNAVRHGLTAKTLVLSNESQTKFDELLQSYIRKFLPRDEVEMDLVSELVAAQWRLRRNWLIQTAALDLQMDKQEEEIAKTFTLITEPTRLGLAFTTMANNEKSLQLLLRYETTYRRMYSQALGNLLKLRESVGPEEIPNDANPAESPGDSPIPRASESQDALTESRVPTSGIEHYETNLTEALKPPPPPPDTVEGRRIQSE